MGNASSRSHTRTKNRKNLQALAEHACTQQGRVHVEGVHATHVLKLHGVRQMWVCEGFGGQMSLSTKPISQKLSVACAFKKHPSCKTRFPTTNPTLRSPLQQTAGSAQVGQDKPRHDAPKQEVPPSRSSLSRKMRGMRSLEVPPSQEAASGSGIARAVEPTTEEPAADMQLESNAPPEARTWEQRDRSSEKKRQRLQRQRQRPVQVRA